MRRVNLWVLFLILGTCILFSFGCAKKDTVEKQEEIKQEEQEKEENEKPEEETPETPVVETPEPTPTPTVTQPQPSDKTYYIKVNRLANCVTIYAKDENVPQT